MKRFYTLTLLLCVVHVASFRTYGQQSPSYPRRIYQPRSQDQQLAPNIRVRPSTPVPTAGFL